MEIATTISNTHFHAPYSRTQHDCIQHRYCINQYCANILRYNLLIYQDKQRVMSEYELHQALEKLVKLKQISQRNNFTG